MGFFHHPFFNVACTMAEVYSQFVDFSRIRGKRQCILFVIDLFQGFFRTSVQLELHDVNILRCFYYQINASSEVWYSAWV